MTLIPKRLVLIGVMLLMALGSAGAANDLKALYDSLQIAISMKGVYQEFKEQKIQVLKNTLWSNTLNQEQRYNTYTSLSDEYNKYNLDSAITYTKLALEMAVNLQDENKIIATELRNCVFYSMHGMFHEAEEILKKYDSSTLSKEFLHDYFNARMQYEDFYSYTNKFSSTDLVNAYRDSIIMYSDSTTVEYVYHLASEMPAEQRKPILLDLLNRTGSNTPMYAMVTYSLADAYRDSDINTCKAYYIRSTITDLKNCIKENSSLYNLALILYEEGDLKNAYTFAQSAFDDAISAGIQFRVAQTSTFYSIINESYQKSQAKTQKNLTYALYFLVLITLLLVFAIIYILMQLRRISIIRKDLATRNKELAELNEKLQWANQHLGDNNTQLMENNNIKEQYIGQFYNICSGYIDKIGIFQRELLRTASRGNLEELTKKLRSTTLVDDEIEALYAHFDSIFLSLYPTFVSDINAMLRKEEQMTLKNDNLLNKEFRILALLRLGITDSEKISSFLHCSISTIYNYRTKMRNKAIDKEHFEENICKIGKI